MVNINEPTYWGPHAWMFLHIVAINYNPSKNNPTKTEQYYEFFKNIGYILPCHKCQQHYQSHFGDGNELRDVLYGNGKDGHDPRALFHWTVDMHNQVNISTGKNQISYRDAYNTLVSHTQTVEIHPLKSPATQLFIFCILLFGFAMIVYLWKSRTHKIHSVL